MRPRFCLSRTGLSLLATTLGVIAGLPFLLLPLPLISGKLLVEDLVIRFPPSMREAG